MTARSQPYRIEWPLNAEQAANIDEMFQLLFDDLRNGSLIINLVTQVTGTLAVTHGGTGTATAFTKGSVVFAGAGGIYSQNNARFFWDDTLRRLGIGTSTPNYGIQVAVGTIAAGLADSNNGAKLYLLGSNNQHNFLLANQQSVNDAFEITPSTAIGGTTFTTPALVVLGGGNVGIGLTSPSVPLHVKATAIRVEGSGSDVSVVQFYDNTGTLARGNVGNNAGDVQLVAQSGTLLLNGNNRIRAYPNIDSTTAFQFKKADAITTVVDIDTSTPGMDISTQAAVYGTTIPDAVNYERLRISWDATQYNIFTEKAGTGAARQLRIGVNGTAAWVIDTANNTGIGVSAPTAVLHVKAGTATANTAPIKLTSGTVLTTPEAGTIEYDGTNFYLTP